MTATLQTVRHRGATSVSSVVRFSRVGAVSVLILVTSTLVSWFRLGDVQRATLWAEDGRNFVSDFMVDGFWSTL